MSFTLAIVGRPNVGKSTLFNRLAGKRLAIVEDTPGVTRDWRSAPGRLGPLDFTVIDTAGLEDAAAGTLEDRMRRQTERAMAEADVVLFLVDARSGITPLDRDVAEWLRRTDRPVLLAANKSEGRAGDSGYLEAFELGLGEPLRLSAAHGEGMGDLLDLLLPFDKTPPDDADLLEEEDPFGDAGADAGEALAEEDGEDQAQEELPPETDDRVIQLAIVGRPNVGKSTLVNALLEDERMLTGPEPGMTRDAIATDWQWRGRDIRLVDTAGLRKRARIHESLEKLTASDTMNAVRLAQMVVLVVDAEAPLERQDLVIARHVVEEGRGLLIAVNKWDLVADHQEVLQRVRERLEESLAQVKGVPVVTISAIKGRRLDRLMDAVLDLYGIWNRRIGTGPLNRWLGTMLQSHPPPMVAGRRLKLRYITQIKSRPPTFALWTSRPDEVPESYLRYLVNGLRERFGLAGVPVRLWLRKGENPYAGRKRR